MEKLFAYGTLTDLEIQQDVFGRSLKGKKDSLIGYVLDQIKVEEEFGMANYPIIIKTDLPENKIEGFVFEISSNDILNADTYEGKLYKRIEVTLESNEVAWVYTAVK